MGGVPGLYHQWVCSLERLHGHALHGGERWDGRYRYSAYFHRLVLCSFLAVEVAQVPCFILVYWDLFASPPQCRMGEAGPLCVATKSSPTTHGGGRAWWL